MEGIDCLLKKFHTLFLLFPAFLFLSPILAPSFSCCSQEIVDVISDSEDIKVP